MERQFFTATNFLSQLIFSCIPLSNANWDVKITDVDCTALPNDPNMGRYNTGSVVGIDAFGSPIKE